MPGNRIWQPIVRHGRPPICGVYMQGSIKKERKGLHKEYRGDGEFIAKRHTEHKRTVSVKRRASESNMYWRLRNSEEFQ